MKSGVAGLPLSPSLVAAVAALLISGCATTSAPKEEKKGPVMAPEMAWRVHRHTLAPIDRFLATGRVTSSELSLRADLRWQQSANGSFELRLAGPFGAGAVELRGTKAAVEVRSSEGVECTLDPEGWIRNTYGWSLPINGLRYWVLGLPIPGKPSTRELNADGRLARMSQNGWTLEYTEYRRQGEYDLPRRFEIDNGQVRLKLLIDRWENLPTTTAAALP